VVDGVSSQQGGDQNQGEKGGNPPQSVPQSQLQGQPSNPQSQGGNDGGGSDQQSTMSQDQSGGATSSDQMVQQQSQQVDGQGGKQHSQRDYNQKGGVSTRRVNWPQGQTQHTPRQHNTPTHGGTNQGYQQQGQNWGKGGNWAQGGYSQEDWNNWYQSTQGQWTGQQGNTGGQNQQMRQQGQNRVKGQRLSPRQGYEQGTPKKNYNDYENQHEYGKKGNRGNRQQQQDMMAQLMQSMMFGMDPQQSMEILMQQQQLQQTAPVNLSLASNLGMDKMMGLPNGIKPDGTLDESNPQVQTLLQQGASKQVVFQYLQ